MDKKESGKRDLSQARPKRQSQDSTSGLELTVISPDKLGINKNYSSPEFPRNTSSIKLVAPIEQQPPTWRRWFCCFNRNAKEDAFAIKKRSMADLKKELFVDDHMIPKMELLRRLDVDCDKGLSATEAAARLGAGRGNTLTPPKQTPEIVKYLKELVWGFGPLILAGAFVSIIAYIIQVGMGDAPPDNLYLFIVLFVIDIFTGTFTYCQKKRSEKIMDSFCKMVPETANVLRDGRIVPVSASSLVVGDIVQVRGGDRVPADIRVLSSQGLKIDNSSLTGESELQVRHASDQEQENILEARNMCFYTTYAVEGDSMGVVVQTGDNTVMGRVAKLTTSVKENKTPIGREIDNFVIIITVIAVIMATAYMIFAFSVHIDWLDVLILSLGLMVANIPESILIMVTAQLTMTAKRLSKKNCLIKNLEAVETLGSCSVICSDKTGTLTQNRMTVSHLWLDDSSFEADQLIEAITNKQSDPRDADLTRIVRVAGLCSRAKFRLEDKDEPIMKRRVLGDASESALLRFGQQLTSDAEGFRNNNPAVAEIPFNSTNKYQVSVHQLAESERYIVVMKGAPERILDSCSRILIEGQEHRLTDEWRCKFQDACMEYGALGERVLAFAECLLPEDHFPSPYPFTCEPEVNFPLDNLCLVGLISMLDPPRANVPDAVSKCRSAGIRVIMVTGDHPITAKAIARAVGIISEGSYTVDELAEQRGVRLSKVNPKDASAAVVHGGDLAHMDGGQLRAVLQNHSEIVFARTSPQQKLLIVEACQSLGMIVAVTGDGVNDSPALKQADIGIAMGITGSDVSKHAADMVLLDDNFASIVSGIEEGRLIFDNIKKTCCYALTTDIPEMAAVILYFVLNIPLGLYTISMILLNCGTDMIPAISLAHESAEGDTMKMPPRKQSERLITSNLIQAVYLQIGIIECAGAYFVYFVIFGASGFLPNRVLGLREDWEDTSNQELKDSYGQEWNYAQRKQLEHVVQSGYFLAVVLQNMVHVMVRRVRRKSIFQKGMGNYFLIFAICFEGAICCLFIYTPGLRTALGFSPVWPVWALAIAPFCLLIFCYDELRRLLIRRFGPNSWVEENLHM